MSSRSATEPVVILLVEDDPDDADLMREALRDGALPVRVQWVEDGEEAMAYLRRQDPYRDEPRPHLILLDLRLPRKNGQEVLDEIRGDAELSYLPVVIMTSNDAVLDRVWAHLPNCCVTKPANQEQYRCVVKKIEHFWLAVARLP